MDDDLGKSGSGAVERPGFSRSVTAVCEGKAGAMFALEASRLARNNRDWYHLLEFCTVTETLVVDYDGIYDPRSPNDRLVLGLKGTMAELELGILRQRAREAFLAKVRRGKVMSNLSVGYLRTEAACRLQWGGWTDSGHMISESTRGTLVSQQEKRHVYRCRQYLGLRLKWAMATTWSRSGSSR